MSTALTPLEVASARLPQTYENAKKALAECAKIDECKKWANKAEALSSYARMADDDGLRKMADRIQGRAVRRCGELLEGLDARGAHRRKDGTVLSSKEQKATAAGMSERQRKTAVRVANVPVSEFEVAIESEDPPTVTALAEQGKKPRAPAPEGFVKATRLIGTVRSFSKFCDGHDPALIANGVYDYEKAEVRDFISIIDIWLSRFVVHLEEENATGS